MNQIEGNQLRKKLPAVRSLRTTSENTTFLYPLALTDALFLVALEKEVFNKAKDNMCAFSAIMCWGK